MGEAFGMFLMVALFILIPWAIYNRIKRDTNTKSTAIPPQKKPTLLFSMLLFFGLVLTIIGMGLNQFLLWLPVQGRVYSVSMENGQPLEHLAIESNTLPSNGQSYIISNGRLIPLGQIPHVVYSYRVNQQLYSSDNLRYLDTQQLAPEAAQELRRKYLNTGDVTVYYNPLNPDTSYLERKHGNPVVQLGIPVAGIVLILLGFVGMWILRRPNMAENENHIKWWHKPGWLATGSGATLVVAAIAILGMPYLFGEQATPDEKTGAAMLSVQGVSWSPDNSRLAAGTREGFIALWDSRTGELTQRLEGHQGTVNHAAWSPDGTMLASAGDDLKIIIWDAETGQLSQTLLHHEAPVQYVAWSPDGSRLASQASDGWILIWDVAAGSALGGVHTDAGGCQIERSFPANCLAWSPDGTLLAVGGGELLDPTTQTVLNTITTHELNVDWSLDGQRIVYGTAVWEIVRSESGLAVSEIINFKQEHTGFFGSVDWSPDGTSIAVGTSDAAVRIWSVDTWQPTFTLRGHTGWIFEVAYNSDSTLLASASDKEIIVWNVQDGTQVLQIIP